MNDAAWLKDGIDWIIKNKEWLFSGTVVAVVGWIGRIIFKKASVTSSQAIRAGDSSINVQAGRNVNIGTNKKKSDVEEG